MIGGIPLSYFQLKLFIDQVGAWILLILAFPIFFILGLLIKLEDPTSSVFFKQERIGQNEQTFTLYKLRSMQTATVKNGQALSDDDRLLFIGKFIRSTSLDELPQLWNIIKGDMSFIGPRPLLVDYLPYYSETERRRHRVKPGISGLAQVSGRNRLTWEEKFALDVNYVDQQSFQLDTKIFFLTLQKVLKKSDIVLAGRETTKSLVEHRLEETYDKRNQSV